MGLLTLLQEAPANEQLLLREVETSSSPAAVELDKGHVVSGDRMTNDLLMDLGCWVEFMMAIRQILPPGACMYGVHVCSRCCASG